MSWIQIANILKKLQTRYLNVKWCASFKICAFDTVIKKKGERLLCRYATDSCLAGYRIAGYLDEFYVGFLD